MAWATLFLLSFTTVLSPHLTLSTNTTKGFSLQLMDLDSANVENLSTTQRLRHLIDSSDARLRWLDSSARQPQDIGISPPITFDAYKYMVRLEVSSQPIYQNLVLDTGSQLTWIQCYPHIVGFPQDPPHYRNARSDSFSELPCNHRLCQPRICVHGVCHFLIRYLDTTYTKGLLGKEIFTSRKRNGGTETFGPLVFGCSKHSSIRMFHGTSQIAGILGMGGGPKSFVSQLGDEIEHCFSYCLPPWGDPGPSYLRVGSDVVLRGNEQSLQLQPPYTRYYLALDDISVNNQNLHLPQGIFARHADGTGGFMVDSGSGLTWIIRPAYNAVKRELKNYFRAHNLQIVRDHQSGLDLCYHLPQSFEAYPSMTFHFGETRLLLGKDNLFKILQDSTFCLTMRPNNHRTIFGAAQMANIRFVYDIRNRRLSFAPEICAQH